jgi:hypothetical protein
VLATQVGTAAGPTAQHIGVSGGQKNVQLPQGFPMQMPPPHPGGHPLLFKQWPLMQHSWSSHVSHEFPQARGSLPSARQRTPKPGLLQDSGFSGGQVQPAMVWLTQMRSSAGRTHRSPIP